MWPRPCVRGMPATDSNRCKVVIRCILLQKAGDTRGHGGHVDFIGFFGSVAWGHNGDTWGQAAGTMSPPPAVTSSVAALTWSLIRLSQARATDEDALVRRPGAALVDRVAGDAPALVQLLAASDVAGGKYRRIGSHQCTVGRIVEGLLKRSSCDVAPWPPWQRAVAIVVRLNRAIAEALSLPDIRQRLETLQAEAFPKGVPGAQDFEREEISKWRSAAVEALGPRSE